MASFSVALQSVVFLCLMAANLLESAETFSNKNHIPDINNKLWTKDLDSNLVEAPEPTSIFWKVFEKPRRQKFTANYVKNIVKALFKYDSLHKCQQKPSPKTEKQEMKKSDKPTPIPIEVEDVPSHMPPAIEDLPEIGLHLPSQMEVDKSQKFTHSIRYGYGKSPF